MAQSSPRFCPQCGGPVEAGQRFCTNCGATMSIEASAPTAMATSDQTVMANQSVQSSSPFPATVSASGSTPNTPAPGVTPAVPAGSMPGVSESPYATVPAPGNQFYAQTTDTGIVPPPPPPDSFISTPQQAPISTPQQAPASPYYTPPAPGYTTVPSYARTPRRSRGCLITSIVLLLVLVLGSVGGFYAIRSGILGRGNQNNGQQTTTSGSGSTPNGSGSTPGGGNTPGSSSTSTPTTGGPVTEQLNLKLTYSSIDITLVSVQQASSFPDDSSTSQGGVRVSMKDSNPSSKNIRFGYDGVIRLVLPDNSIVAPSNEKYFAGPDPGVSRDNWIDFAVTAQNIDLSKLILRFGTASENQMDIPLMPNADLSKYQPKTVSPNKTFQYAGMNWTLVSATESLSADGQQAATGMVFITVSLKAVNSSASGFVGFPGDYMRLKSGDTTNAPTLDSTLPVSIASQTTGSGTVIFPATQGITSFTLLLLMRQSSPPINAVSVDFQIQ